jgi:hypothetical protein
MSIRRRFPRLFAVLAMLLVLGFVGGAVIPAGCGGGDAPKKKKKKKKKKKDKGDAQKGDASQGSGDPDLMAKELIKDQFTGVYSDVFKGNAGPPELYAAMTKAEKALEEYEKTEWNDEFNTMIMGLHYARVECAEWFLSTRKAIAFGNLEDEEGGKKALQEAVDFLKDVNREGLEDVKVGEAKVSYKQYYDDAQKKIQAAIKELAVMVAIVKRTPPDSEVNLFDQDQQFWEKEGAVDATFAAGELVLECTGKSGRLNSTHYFLKDFRAKLTFSIQSGGFDIMLRALPGKGTSLAMGINQGDVPPGFTLIVTVTGNNIRFEDKDGNILDEFTSKKAPKGGGISLLVRQGASVVFQEFLLEPM